METHAEMGVHLCTHTRGPVPRAVLGLQPADLGPPPSLSSHEPTAYRKHLSPLRPYFPVVPCLLLLPLEQSECKYTHAGSLLWKLNSGDKSRWPEKNGRTTKPKVNR